VPCSGYAVWQCSQRLGSMYCCLVPQRQSTCTATLVSLLQCMLSKQARSCPALPPAHGRVPAGSATSDPQCTKELAQLTALLIKPFQPYTHSVSSNDASKHSHSWG
jgi:hypothetical protein